MRLRHFALALLLLGPGCGSWVIPVDPVHPPGPVVPPDNPPHDPTSGAITQAQFDAIGPASTDAAIRASLGAPFQEADAAGFHLLKYVEKGTSGVFTFWMKAGVLDHKDVIR